jgi:ferritin
MDNSNMLSETVVNKLNEQINLEFYSSNFYLQMAAWCESKGLEGSASFLYQHAREETTHMQRLYQYVNGAGAMAVIGAIDAPPTDFKSLPDVFTRTYEHECFITTQIHQLVHTAFAEQDYTTFNFLQWYVGEQHEEEKTFKSILDKIGIIGADPKNLFFLDKEIGNMANNKLVPVDTATGPDDT